MILVTQILWGITFDYTYRKRCQCQILISQEMVYVKYMSKQPPAQALKKKILLWSFILSTCLAAGNKNRLARWGPEGQEAQGGHVSACHTLVGPASVKLRVPLKQWQTVTEVWENGGKEQKKNDKWCCRGMVLSRKLYEMCTGWVKCYLVLIIRVRGDSLKGFAL